MSFQPYSTEDEEIARSLSQTVRDEREAARTHSGSSSSSYISTFVSEFLDDMGGIIRCLRAYKDDTDRATQSIAATLQWRESNKVYPAKRAIGREALMVDPSGWVSVRARQASVLPRPRDASARGWRNLGRAIETLEDARVALKTAYCEFGVIAQAAIIVPVESLSLADIVLEDLRQIISTAETHYPGVVAHIYVTATSSVLLGHAKQALRPVLSLLSHEMAAGVEFVLANSLSATLTQLGSFISARSEQQPCMSLSPSATLVGGGSSLTLSDFVKRAESVVFTEADDEFCSAYSEAPDTYMPTNADVKRSVSRLSLSSHFLYDKRGTNTHSSSLGLRKMMSALDMSGPTRATSKNGADQSKTTSSSITPVQLASLQRAVQSVQRMLGSINDSITNADSRSALAATKSKLVQQADVLMSTVAALNFGVSMMDTKSIEHSKYTLLSDAAGGSNSNTSMMYRMGLQLLALPMSLLFGRSGSGLLAVVRHLVTRTIHTAMRRLRALPAASTLLLLAYKHLRIYAMIFWTGALLIWKANAALIWSNLTTQWRRGVAF
ncbi:hypothetical protein GGI15_002770 [Coemansia interrupta]|uniref:Uncharacterized protein n=1 Tax=Coemansia interrupta TaxID=1126814 RepID=A0A9W8HFN7_9FUNG|nr:hypothetical protein GGI15_002770 [Coemansia interrupta]